MRPLPAAAAALALLLAASAARADVTAVTSFGFEGTAVPGTVAPVRVDLSSSEKEPVRIRVEISRAGNVPGLASDDLVHGTEAFLAPGAKKRITLPVVHAPNSPGEWRITLKSDRRVLLRHGTKFEDGRELQDAVGGGVPGSDISANAPVVGVLGDPSRRVAWMEDANRFGRVQRGAAQARDVVIQPWWGEIRLVPGGGAAAALPRFLLLDPAAAPDTWLAYEGLDAILWVDPDPDALKDQAPLDAILEYAACGGRLVVAWTPGAKIAAASPLAAALPGRARGHDDVPEEEVLAAACGSPVPKERKGKTLPVARLEGIAGRVRAALPDGRPLVVDVSRGLGSVMVLAFDPRLLGAAGPRDQALLLRRIFGPVAWAREGREEQHPRAPTLEPTLHHLRKRFLSAPPLGLLVLGLLLYVAAIGPVDYFLLKRKGKLRRTVVTFPLIVIGFTLLAYGSSFLLFGGASGQARLAILDVATAPGRDADVVRGLDIVGSYSPTGTTLEIAYDAPRSFLASPWLGSGHGWGGREGGSLAGTVTLGPDGRPGGAFDLPLRSHRTVQARFSAEAPLTLDARWTAGPGGGRRLEVRNHLQRPILDAVVVEGKRAFSLGNLAPGAAVAIAADDPSWGAFPPAGRMVEPFDGTHGLFSQSWGAHGIQGAQFVPEGESPDADATARERLARAVLGASVGGLFQEAPTGEIRILGRQGLDLSGAVRDGRTLVMGWCDGDPLGTLPSWKNVVSTIVVVRRILPAGEKP